MTIAVVLVYISGVASVAMGTLILLSRYRVEPAQVLPVSLLGAAVILFGLLTLAVASGVSRGRRLARLLLTIYVAVQVTLHIVTIVSTESWDWSAATEMVVDAFIVIALWAPPGLALLPRRAASIRSRTSRRPDRARRGIGASA